MVYLDNYESESGFSLCIPEKKCYPNTIYDIKDNKENNNIAYREPVDEDTHIIGLNIYDIMTHCEAETKFITSSRNIYNYYGEDWWGYSYSEYCQNKLNR